LFGLNNALFLHVISYFIKLNKQHISSVFFPIFHWLYFHTNAMLAQIMARLLQHEKCNTPLIIWPKSLI